MLIQLIPNSEESEEGWALCPNNDRNTSVFKLKLAFIPHTISNKEPVLYLFIEKYEQSQRFSGNFLGTQQRTL